MSAAEAESTKKAAPRVVVAEDEALNRMDIVESLESAGYEVVGEAANGQEAVDLVKKTHPDVVVMDIKMPVKDGITAAREINEEFIAPVVMLTAFSQKDLVAEAVDADVMAYLVKPFVPGKLFPTIEVAMQRWQQMVALRGRLSGISPEQTAAEGSDEEVAKLREQVEDLKGRLESRKHVDCAKGLLMEHMGLTEQEAFRWIQKTSMDRRLTMQEVADAVIAQIEGDELED